MTVTVPVLKLTALDLRVLGQLPARPPGVCARHVARRIMTASVVHLRWSETLVRGDRYLVPARCIGVYVRALGRPVGCGWTGHIVRTLGEHRIPRCPRCGGWTEPTA